jgi:predicted nucleic acid-binding protein
VRYLLDTTLLIDHANGLPAAVQTVESLFEEPNDLYTCDVVTAEALSGGTDEQRRVIRSMLDVLEYVSTSPDAARSAGESRRLRGADGRRGIGDALIAAVAHQLDAVIVTRNPRDFEQQGVPVRLYA